jgi:hypothetical protein
MNRLLTLLILFLLFSCDTKQESKEINLLDFKSFTIETPQSWKKIESRGVDSYVGGIQFDSTQGASFDLGLYSNDLSEFVKINLTDTTYSLVETGKNPPLVGDSNFMEKVKKCKVLWDTIDGYKAKLVIPINTGLGVTGIYFDSLWQTQSGNVKFQLSGNNLNPKNETDLIKAFKTLRFNRNPH